MSVHHRGGRPAAGIPAEAISRELRWSSLKWQPASFIDDRLRDSESDLLYAIERTEETFDRLKHQFDSADDGEPHRN